LSAHVCVTESNTCRIEDILEASDKQTTIGRTGRPEEIARVIHFLISNENTFMHGAEVVLDGGSMLQ